MKRVLPLLALLIMLSVLIGVICFLLVTRANADSSPEVGTPGVPEVGTPSVLMRCDAHGMQYWRDRGIAHQRTVRMAKCLAGLSGLNVSWSEADKVARCESGWYAKAHSANGSYHGIFQLGMAEFSTYWQGSGQTWVNREFRQNGWKKPRAVFDARANIIATFVRAHNEGWGAWSCA